MNYYSLSIIEVLNFRYFRYIQLHFNIKIIIYYIFIKLLQITLYLN